MEIKINREIRDYTEKLIFGLTLRQAVFSILGCIVSVVLYFAFDGKVNSELLSWMCMIGAAPFFVLGFFRYNGLSAEKFIWAWIKSELLMKRYYTFKSTNLYYEIMRAKKSIEGGANEKFKKNVKE